MGIKLRVCNPIIRLKMDDAALQLKYTEAVLRLKSAVTCDGTTVESSFTLEAGTHTILITITGYHYGTVKAGTLYVYGKTTSNPTVTLN